MPDPKKPAEPPVPDGVEIGPRNPNPEPLTAPPPGPPPPPPPPPPSPPEVPEG